MPTQTKAVYYTLTGDAEFRAWGTAINAALAAVGLVQTADTGQINWGTVTKPLAANTPAGYEIWRFNDALQATAPVFLKIEYGTGGAVTYPAFWLTVGAATDGAGTFTGPTSTRTQCHAVTSVTGTRMYYISGATSRVALTNDAAASNQSHMFAVERTKDVSGGDTSEGVLILTVGLGGASAKQQVWFPSGAGAQESNWGCLMPTVGTGANGTQIAVYPIFHTKGVFMYPGLNAFAFVPTNISAYTPITVNWYGADHVFLPLSSTQMTAAAFRIATSGTFAIRWE